MNNSEIVNAYENQEIDNIVWPFYRYSALIPEHIAGDLFVWLYLSLFIYTNQSKGLSQNSYTDEVKNEVIKVISEKFKSVIDDQTLAKIISNAESDNFIIGSKENRIISDDTFSFINTYESLFSNKLEIKYIYQDAITGEVLPFFGSTDELKDTTLKKNVLQEKHSIKEPSKRAIKRAYEQYMKLKKYNAPITEELPEDEYFDEDEQTFLDDEPFETKISLEENEKKNLNDYNVIFLENSKVLFKLNVPVFVEDNSLVVKSPFDKTTETWLNRCLIKAKNVSSDLERIMNELKVYLIEEKKIDDFFESNKKNDVSSSLKYCGKLYRLIDSLNDNRLKKHVLDIEGNFKSKNEYYFVLIGKLLDRMIKILQYPGKTTAEVRYQTTFDVFCREIDYKCMHKNLNYEFLKSKNIYDNWVKKYNKQGKEFYSFKSDLTDIILRTNLINSPNVYPDFIDDMFNLYSLRNAVAHDDDTEMRIEQSQIDKLAKVVSVFIELF